MVEACDEGGTWAREQLLLRQTLAGRRFRWCWRGEGAEAWTSACQGRPLAWGTLHYLQVSNALSLVPASNTQHAAAMYCPMRLRRMHTMCLSSHPLHVVGLPSHNDGANSDDGPQRATRSDSFTGDPGRDVTVSSTSCSFVSGDQLSRASVERYRTQASPAET